MSTKRRSGPPEMPAESVKRPKKSVACHRCHSHKIKCSGEHPCSKCIQTGHSDQCRYSARDRKVKVSENYLQQLLEELRYFKGQSPVSPTTVEDNIDGEDDDDDTVSHRTGTVNDSDETNASIQHHFIGDKAWFHPYNPSTPPIYVGEAACTAFATRFRRILTGPSATAHIPRTHYVNEASIYAAMKGEVQWPSLQQARLLVKITTLHVGRLYHMFLRKSTLDKLEEIYRTESFHCPQNKAKYFALFAFGEAYSVRPGLSPESVPGTMYFAQALDLNQIIQERPSMMHLETLLLLSLFSYFLNRRHSACVLAGNAMRLGLIIGLNHNIPDSQLIDPIEMEHRIRLWWTIYIFNHMWSSKMGLPLQISEDDIHIGMPSESDTGLSGIYNEQFTDTGFIIANITLARIAGDIITQVYSRKKYRETFLQRVQGLLKALKNWVQALPEHLKINSDPESNKKHVISLHLSFNQVCIRLFPTLVTETLLTANKCVILTTRPTLLHSLDRLNNHGSSPAQDNHKTHDSISHAVLTLNEACIHAARHSHSIILEKWIHGSLPMFGYFHAQYLFSSAMILAISSLMLKEGTSDQDSFETALRLLHGMNENGNLAAAEFYSHLEKIKICLDHHFGNSKNDPNGPVQPSSLYLSSSLLQTGSVNDAGATRNYSGVSFDNIQALTGDGPSYTTEMAFLEPTMESFLAQSNLNLGFPHSVDSFMNDADSIYTATSESFGPKPLTRARRVSTYNFQNTKKCHHAPL